MQEGQKHTISGGGILRGGAYAPPVLKQWVHMHPLPHGSARHCWQPQIQFEKIYFQVVPYKIFLYLSEKYDSKEVVALILLQSAVYHTYLPWSIYCILYSFPLKVWNILNKTVKRLGRNNYTFVQSLICTVWITTMKFDLSFINWYFFILHYYVFHNAAISTLHHSFI